MSRKHIPIENVIIKRTTDFYQIITFANVWTIHYYFNGDVGEFFRALINSNAISFLRDFRQYTRHEIKTMPETVKIMRDIDMIIEAGQHNNNLTKEIFSIVLDENKKQKRINYAEIIDKMIAHGRLLKFGPFSNGHCGSPRAIYTLPERDLQDIFGDSVLKRKILRASPALFTKRQRRLIHKFWPEAELTIVPEDII